jgi:hypothetical protein
MMVGPNDYVAILDLYSTYNHLADGDDPLAYGECYSPEGQLTSAGRVIGENRHQIVEFRRRNIAARVGVRRHFTTNIRLDSVDTSTVRGRCYMQAYDFTPDGKARLTHSGTYADVIVRAEGRWQFSSRELSMDFVAQ